MTPRIRFNIPHIRSITVNIWFWKPYEIISVRVYVITIYNRVYGFPHSVLCYTPHTFDPPKNIYLIIIRIVNKHAKQNSQLTWLLVLLLLVLFVTHHFSPKIWKKKTCNRMCQYGVLKSSGIQNLSKQKLQNVLLFHFIWCRRGPN